MLNKHFTVWHEEEGGEGFEDGSIREWEEQGWETA